MAITIIQPKPIPRYTGRDVRASSDTDSDSEMGGVDLDGDVSMNTGHSSKRANHSSDIVTPGEVITDDSQYMRYVCKSHMPCAQHISQSQITNAILIPTTEATGPTLSLRTIQLPSSLPWQAS